VSPANRGNFDFKRPQLASDILDRVKDMFSGWGSSGAGSGWGSAAGAGSGSQNATFIDAITTNFRRTLDIKGRTERTSFWYFALAMFAALIVVGMAVASDGEPMTAAGAMLLLSVPLITASVRRLHDTDRTGWWALLFVVMLAPMLLIVLGALAGLIYLLAQPGDAGVNRFGPAPGTPIA
jgi:uncharacterized membrane protein YhaH (DUF805 family)